MFYLTVKCCSTVIEYFIREDSQENNLSEDAEMVKHVGVTRGRFGTQDGKEQNDPNDSSKLKIMCIMCEKDQVRRSYGWNERKLGVFWLYKNKTVLRWQAPEGHRSDIR